MKKLLFVLPIILAMSVSSYANPVDSLANYEPGSNLIPRTFGWTGSDLVETDNPVSDAVNSSSRVLEFTRSSQYSSAIVLGNFGGNDAPRSLFQFPLIKLKAMSATSTEKLIRVQAYDINGYSVIVADTMPATANVWEDFTFDFTSKLMSTPISFIKSITIFINSGDATTGEVYYIDDVLLSGPAVSTITEATTLTLFKEQFSSNGWFLGDSTGALHATENTLEYFRTAEWGGSALSGSASHYIATDSLKMKMINWNPNSFGELFPVSERPDYSFINFMNFDIAGLNNLTISYDLQWVSAPTSYSNAITVEYQLDGGSWTELTTASTLPSTTGSWTTDITYVLPSLNGQTLNFRLTNNETANLYVENIALKGKKIFATNLEISAPDTMVVCGGALQLTNTVSPANANQAAYWYISAGDTAASIDPFTGLLTAGTNHGVATVTAIALDITGSASKTLKVYVNYPVDSISVTSEGDVDTIKTLAGQLQMYAEVFPDTADFKTVKWSTQDITGKASVNSSGLVTAQKNGKVKVIATAIDGSGIFDVDTLVIINQIEAEAIEISSAKGLILDKDDMIDTLIATISPANAQPRIVEWFCSDANGDTVAITAINDTTIAVQAIRNGEVKIIAKSFTNDVADTVTITISNQIVRDWYELTVENVVVGSVDSPEDFTGNVLMSWDADSVYMIFDIVDDSIVNAGTSYQVDNIEIYFDMDNSKNIHWPRNGGWISNDPTYDENDYQFRLVPDSAFSVNNSARPNGQSISGGYNQVYSETDNGYRFILNVAWDSLLDGFDASAGALIGFDLLISDNDAVASDANRNQITWNSLTDKAFNDPSLWGTLEFVDGGSFISIADEEVPSVPANVTATVTASDVELTWDASTDNRVVQEYIILQGTTAIDTILAKETGNSYSITGLADGNYTFHVVAVDIYRNASEQGSSAEVIVPHIISVSSPMVKVNIYPNPVEDLFHIDSNSEILEVVITNTGGKTERVVSVNSYNTTVDFSDLAKGLYVVQIRTTSGISIQKVINK